MIPYTTIPFVSAILLVMVGVLIGQILWSRFRSKHQRTIVRLRRRLQKQQLELKNCAIELNELSQQLSATTEAANQQAGELKQRRHECQHLQSTQRQLIEQLERETKTREDLVACLEDERQRHEQAARQVGLLRLRVSQDGETNEASERKRLEAETLNRSLADQLDRLQGEHGQLLKQMDAIRIDQAAWDKLVAERQEVRDAAASWQAEADERSRSLSTQAAEIHRLNELVETLRADVRDGTVRCNQLEQDQLQRVASEQTLTKQLESEQAKLAQLEASRDRLQSQCDDARRENDRLAEVEDRCVELEAQIRQAHNEHKRLRRERDDALEIEATTRRIVGEFRDELDEQLKEVAILQREKEMSASQLEFECRQKRQLEEALQLAENRHCALETEKAAWSERQMTFVAQVSELTEQIRSWQLQAYDFEQRAQRAERYAAELAQQLDSQQQLVDRMRHRRFTASDSVSSDESRCGLSFLDMRRRQMAIDVEASEGSTAELGLGTTAELVARQGDDLKKIPGIADRVEEQLHQLGIYTFRQVMELDRKAIAEISRRLGLGDLVDRHDWVNHARRLHHENERHIA